MTFNTEITNNAARHLVLHRRSSPTENVFCPQNANNRTLPNYTIYIQIYI